MRICIYNYNIYPAKIAVTKYGHHPHHVDSSWGAVTLRHKEYTRTSRGQHAPKFLPKWSAPHLVIPPPALATLYRSYSHNSCSAAACPTCDIVFKNETHLSNWWQKRGSYVTPRVQGERIRAGCASYPPTQYAVLMWRHRRLNTQNCMAATLRAS